MPLIVLVAFATCTGCARTTDEAERFASTIGAFDGDPDHIDGVADPDRDWVVRLSHASDEGKATHGQYVCSGFLATPQVVITSAECLWDGTLDYAIDVGDSIGFGPMLPTTEEPNQPYGEHKGDHVFDEVTYRIVGYVTGREPDLYIDAPDHSLPEDDDANRARGAALLFLDRRVDFQIAKSRRPSFAPPNSVALLDLGPPPVFLRTWSAGGRFIGWDWIGGWFYERRYADVSPPLTFRDSVSLNSYGTSVPNAYFGHQPANDGAPVVSFELGQPIAILYRQIRYLEFYRPILKDFIIDTLSLDGTEDGAWFGDYDYDPDAPLPPGYQDSDGDHIFDDLGGTARDNCPLDYNPDQLDGDGDGVGDVCDNANPPPHMAPALVSFYFGNPKQEDCNLEAQRGHALNVLQLSEAHLDPIDAAEYDQSRRVLAGIAYDWEEDFIAIRHDVIRGDVSDDSSCPETDAATEEIGDWIYDGHPLICAQGTLPPCPVLATTAITWSPTLTDKAGPPHTGETGFRRCLCDEPHATAKERFDNCQDVEGCLIGVAAEFNNPFGRWKQITTELGPNDTPVFDASYPSSYSLSPPILETRWRFELDAGPVFNVSLPALPTEDVSALASKAADLDGITWGHTRWLDGAPLASGRQDDAASSYASADLDVRLGTGTPIDWPIEFNPPWSYCAACQLGKVQPFVGVIDPATLLFMHPDFGWTKESPSPGFSQLLHADATGELRLVELSEDERWAAVRGSSLRGVALSRATGEPVSAVLSTGGLAQVVPIERVISPGTFAVEAALSDGAPERRTLILSGRRQQLFAYIRPPGAQHGALSVFDLQSKSWRDLSLGAVLPRHVIAATYRAEDDSLYLLESHPYPGETHGQGNGIAAGGTSRLLRIGLRDLRADLQGEVVATLPGRGVRKRVLLTSDLHGRLVLSVSAEVADEPARIALIDVSASPARVAASYQTPDQVLLTGVPNTLNGGGVVSYAFELPGGERSFRHISLSSFTDLGQPCQKALKGWL